jgi:peptide methionine sulfoxide reductase MsrA
VLATRIGGLGSFSRRDVVEIMFDPVQTSFGELLRFVFAAEGALSEVHRGDEVATRHRAAILTLNIEQRRVVEGAYVKVGTSAGTGPWPGNVIC